MDTFSSFVEKHKTPLIISLFIIFTWIASSPLSVKSWFSGGDSIIHLIRSNDVCYEMSLGNYYPRFLSQACFGKGSPTLNFYPPAFYLLVGYLNKLGFPIMTAMAAVCAAAFFFSAWGMYLWTKKHCGAIGALIAAAIYLFAPYHMADIYLRGALPEFIALAIVPFLFHAIDLTFASPGSFRGIVYTGLASAAILVTHNLTAIMIAPFALCYFLWCRYRFKASYRSCLSACLGPLLGAGLSAFYWVPVLFERKFVLATGVSIVGNLHYSRHFNSIAAFFTAREFGVFTFTPLYALMFLCVMLSMTALVAGRNKSFGLFVLVSGLLSVTMTLSVSAFVYQAVPLLQYLQFPYRYLGPATLFLAAFCALLPSSKALQNRQRAAWAVCCLVVALSLFLSAGSRKVAGRLPYFPPDPVAFSRTSFPIFQTWSDGDFMPVDSDLKRGDVVAFPVVLSQGDLETPVASSNYRISGARLSCRVAVAQPMQLAGPWFYFPGWKATCDGSETPVYADKYGLAAVSVPSGVHDIEMRFGTTGPRIAGWITSGITLALLLCCSFLRGSRRNLRTTLSAGE